MINKGHGLKNKGLTKCQLQKDKNTFWDIDHSEKLKNKIED